MPLAPAPAPTAAWLALLLTLSLWSQPGAGAQVVTEDTARRLLDSGRLVKRLRGSVSPGEGVTHVADYRPPFVTLLLSLTGDADLYLRGSGLAPTPYEFDLKSENFSVDYVVVTEALAPPVTVAVHGSMQSSDNSTFLLEFYTHSAIVDEYLAIRDLLDSQSDAASYFPQDSDSESRRRRPTVERQVGDGDGKGEGDTSLRSVLLELLQRLGRILLFVLEVLAD